MSKSKKRKLREAGLLCQRNALHQRDEPCPPTHRLWEPSPPTHALMNMTLIDLLHEKAMMPFPTMVCLVGSTRFVEAYQDANLRETLNRNSVLTMSCATKTDHDLRLGPLDKTQLDSSHLFKIELADEVLVPNVGGSLGESTRREIEYARMLGKTLRWLVPEVNV